jgi:hypothetical protein
VILPSEKFRIRVTWGGRSESADAISERLAATLTALEAFGGELGRHFVEVTTGTDVTAEPDRISALITAGFEFDREAGDFLWANGSITSYVQDPATPKQRPHLTMRIRAGGERHSALSRPNWVNITFNGARSGTGVAFPVAEEVIPWASDLFEILIAAWNPDAISLDSASLWGDFDSNADPEPEMPSVGYLTWLSDAVVSGLVDVPGASVTRIADGTLISVDFSADDLIGRAEGVARHLHSSGKLLPLPLVQRA